MMQDRDLKYLRDLIGEGEHEQLDFKFEISDARKIARTLSAFSNSRGGKLLIGVKDNGRIAGIRSEEEFHMIESAASLYCRPEVRFESRSLMAEGKTVLEIQVHEAAHKPIKAQSEDDRWMAYIRLKDQSALAHIVQLRIWEEDAEAEGEVISFTRSEKLLLDHLEQQPGASLQELQQNTGSRRAELIALLTRFVRFGIVEILYQGTVAGFRLK